MRSYERDPNPIGPDWTYCNLTRVLKAMGNLDTQKHMLERKVSDSKKVAIYSPITVISGELISTDILIWTSSLQKTAVV
jgi:hypothetical protein